MAFLGSTVKGSDPLIFIGRAGPSERTENYDYISRIFRSRQGTWALKALSVASGTSAKDEHV